MKYNSKEILEITKAKLLNKSLIVNDLRSVDYDTRKIFDGVQSLFISFNGNNTDGHKYIGSAYEKGVRDFIVTDENLAINQFENANFYLVDSPYSAVQSIAGHHRNQFKIPVIAITGSNGKTIVKEWLSQCLSRLHKIVKSPVSFNSQLGTALSLLLIDESHEIAIIEAGVSKFGEMQNLEKIIQPDIGIFTNIGDAHSAGFNSRQEKLEEKLSLFTACKTVVASYDQAELKTTIPNIISEENLLPWSSKKLNDLSQVSYSRNSDHSIIGLTYLGQSIQFKAPFTDEASLENLTHVIFTLLHLQINVDEIQAGILSLDNIPMRLELKEGINGCLVLDDSYSFDIESLKIGIRELHQNANGRLISLILSDLDTQNSSPQAYEQIVKILEEVKPHRLLLIGEKLSSKLEDQHSKLQFQTFENIDLFDQEFSVDNLQNEIILIKGARQFGLDYISRKINARQNKTVLEIDLFALSENIDYYRRSINPDTGIMAVLKASAYGSGSQQLTALINNKSIDILAVAIVEEAIEMRKSGITKPILIFNPHAENLPLVAEYGFDIELSNHYMATALYTFAERQNKPINIHLKLDTGMHRLGFEENDFSRLDDLLDHPNIKVKAIFSHLAASDDVGEDGFTKNQIQRFEDWYEIISQRLGEKPLKHILNTSGATRFPHAQYDFVRIGLGLYGVDLINPEKSPLAKVHNLKSYIVQIKNVEKGETVGYGNRLRLDKSARIAVIGIGYADGLMRRAGENNYKILINGQCAELIGNVCMDLCMVNISELEGVKEGDEVTIFGKNHPIEGLSAACGTIPYEILTRIAPRVKRVYIQ